MNNLHTNKKLIPITTALLLICILSVTFCACNDTTGAAVKLEIIT